MRYRSAGRWRAPLTALAAIMIGAAACSVPTEECAAPLNMRGTWTYVGSQQAPLAASITGTLFVSRQTCRDFEGALDFIQTDARGQRQRIAGRVAGQVIDAKSFAFDGLFGATPRQHLASVRGDSIVGAWLEGAGGATGASGQFSGKREVSP
jgi:hypothetical protein